MKKVLALVICFILLLTFVGCGNASKVELSRGNYYMVGDFEYEKTPYLWLDTENKTFAIGEGSSNYHTESGKFKIVDDMLIGFSKETVVVFEIKNSETLVLIENGDYEKLQLEENRKFVFSEDLH